MKLYCWIWVAFYTYCLGAQAMNYNGSSGMARYPTSGTCGGPYNLGQLPIGTQVVISTNTKPSNYPPNLYCEWDIVVSPGSLIRLDFTYFETECGWDYVTIEDSNGFFANLCGNRDLTQGLQTTFSSSASSLSVIFTSDSSINAMGFEAIITILDQANTSTAGYRPFTPRTQLSATYDTSSDVLYQNMANICVVTVRLSEPPYVSKTAQSFIQSMYIFGGHSNSPTDVLYNDLFVYNFASQNWTTLMSVGATRPSGRYGHSSAVYNGNILIFGSATQPFEIWAYSLGSFQWVAGLSNDFGVFSGAALYHATTNTIRVYGGIRSDSGDANLELIYDLDSGYWHHWNASQNFLSSKMGLTATYASLDYAVVWGGLQLDIYGLNEQVNKCLFGAVQIQDLVGGWSGIALNDIQFIPLNVSSVDSSVRQALRNTECVFSYQKASGLSFSSEFMPLPEATNAIYNPSSCPTTYPLQLGSNPNITIGPGASQVFYIYIDLPSADLYFTANILSPSDAVLAIDFISLHNAVFAPLQGTSNQIYISDSSIFKYSGPYIFRLTNQDSTSPILFDFTVSQQPVSTNNPNIFSSGGAGALDIITFVAIFLGSLLTSLAITYFLNRARDRVAYYRQVAAGRFIPPPPLPPTLWKVEMGLSAEMLHQIEEEYAGLAASGISKTCAEEPLEWPLSVERIEESSQNHLSVAAVNYMIIFPGSAGHIASGSLPPYAIGSRFELCKENAEPNHDPKSAASAVKKGWRRLSLALKKAMPFK
ncbi:uncharacterized protein BJ171DRAFT_600919 [Polychytrium aggregatum]|uniref:uncharacterized protein n=1 Tax=Polychytrium aggregatum TaxID=110093 RepID=UPI0022FE2965|nr:uncharacterized protein BJ171DRAFT_600919 [Polychytrium aggregatum]KAI9202459.1 hypothetical protein BJ171DRAFT_600919 [Polychytrium aggregatum]